MAATKSNNKEKFETVRVLRPHREEGWFCFTEYELPLELLEKEGKVLNKTNPDIFSVFKDQVIEKLRNIFQI